MEQLEREMELDEERIKETREMIKSFVRIIESQTQCIKTLMKFD